MSPTQIISMAFPLVSGPDQAHSLFQITEGTGEWEAWSVPLTEERRERAVSKAKKGHRRPGLRIKQEEMRRGLISLELGPWVGSFLESEGSGP